MLFAFASLYIEEDSNGNNGCIEEESISDMTCNSCADDDTFNDSSLLEYVSEIYEYLKEAEVRLEHYVFLPIVVIIIHKSKSIYQVKS
jgi:hypothetical protein